MAVNPIDAPLALDLKFREAPGGAIRQRRPTVPPPAAVSSETTATEQQQTTPTPAEAQQQAQDQAESVHQPQAAAVALNMNLKFSTDEETGKLVVSVVDPSNGEVLRQMPSEEALKVAAQIGRYQGLFVDLKV